LDHEPAKEREVAKREDREACGARRPRSLRRAKTAMPAAREDREACGARRPQCLRRAKTAMPAARHPGRSLSRPFVFFAFRALRLLRVFVVQTLRAFVI
jgi:hypothetical protein